MLIRKVFCTNDLHAVWHFSLCFKSLYTSLSTIVSLSLQCACYFQADEYLGDDTFDTASGSGGEEVSGGFHLEPVVSPFAIGVGVACHAACGVCLVDFHCYQHVSLMSIDSGIVIGNEILSNLKTCTTIRDKVSLTAFRKGSSGWNSEVIQYIAVIPLCLCCIERCDIRSAEDTIRQAPHDVSENRKIKPTNSFDILAPAPDRTPHQSNSFSAQAFTFLFRLSPFLQNFSQTHSTADAFVSALLGLLVTDCLSYRRADQKRGP